MSGQQDDSPHTASPGTLVANTASHCSPVSFSSGAVTRAKSDARKTGS